MFGYIKADLTKLSKEDTEHYRTVYCTLCNSLKKNYGVFSRYLLNYDITFLAMLKINTAQREEECVEAVDCPYKMKRCNCLQSYEQVFLYCCAVLIILAYEKILDNIRDEHYFKKIFYLILKGIFYRKYRKAYQLYPDLGDKIRQNMILQAETEEAASSTDRAAHPTADSLGLIFAENDTNSALYRFGYMLGRWIYFMDAADDLKDDIKSGNYNPFISGYSAQDMEHILNFSIGEAAQAFCAIPQGAYTPVLENIIYEGTNTAQERVLKGEV
ncbi:MAG: hypothetical protein IJG23_07495 [Clostridia bacterium]|nr:hypothetical protein [Clostridia bacterium]